jgi:hypothetical protein
MSLMCLDGHEGSVCPGPTNPANAAEAAKALKRAVRRVIVVGIAAFLKRHVKLSQSGAW